MLSVVVVNHTALCTGLSLWGGSDGISAKPRKGRWSRNWRHWWGRRREDRDQRVTSTWWQWPTQKTGPISRLTGWHKTWMSCTDAWKELASIQLIILAIENQELRECWLVEQIRHHRGQSCCNIFYPQLHASHKHFGHTVTKQGRLGTFLCSHIVVWVTWAASVVWATFSCIDSVLRGGVVKKNLILLREKCWQGLINYASVGTINFWATEF